MNKTLYAKKVTLVLDEIFLRESLSVNTKNLTYLGLEDWGTILTIKLNWQIIF